MAKLEVLVKDFKEPMVESIELKEPKLVAIYFEKFLQGSCKNQIENKFWEMIGDHHMGFTEMHNGEWPFARGSQANTIAIIEEYKTFIFANGA